MPFPPVGYLQWAHRNMGGEPAPYALASSAAHHLAPEDLGLHLDGLGLTSPTNEGVPELLEALERRYGVPRERLLPTAGCTMANFLLMAALVRRGDRVLVESPTYEPLWRVPKALGARVARLPRRPEEGWRLDPARLDRALRRHPARLVVLSNLHNPTGRFTPPEQVAEIGRIARRHGARVLWDEIYLECRRGEAGLASPARPAAVLDPRASMSTISLNKTYGLGGLKVGWALAPASVVRRARYVADYMYPYNPPLMERLAVQALERLETLRDRALEVAERNRALAGRWVEGRGDLDWSRPDGGFIGFARFRTPGLDSHALEARLAEQGRTLVSPGHHFGDPGGFRMGLGQPDATRLEKGLAYLGVALDGLRR